MIDPRDQMQAEHDARLSEHSAFQAPAAMPSEEEIAHLIDPDSIDAGGIDGRVPMSPEMLRRRGIAVFKARAILDLFAPILAEKERDNRQLKLAVAEEEATSRIGIACWRDRANEMEARARAAEQEASENASRETLWREQLRKEEARALAAEAALAAERERCLAIVEAQVPDWVKERSGPYWDGYREAMEDAAEDMRKGAAAIRAEGE